MTQKIATLIRRYPFIIRIPYLIFRRLQPRFTIGVVGIVFDDQSRVLLVEHVFHPENPWGLPGGWIDRNEDPAEGVARELKEELQLVVKVEQTILVEKSFNNHIDLAYYCNASDATVGEISNELLSFNWYALDELPALKDFHLRAIRRAFEYVSWSK